MADNGEIDEVNEEETPVYSAGKGKSFRYTKK